MLKGGGATHMNEQHATGDQAGERQAIADPLHGHTGRYTLQAFMDAAPGYNFEFEERVERAVNGSESRSWDVERQENEDDKERRRWVVWMVLKWSSL